MLASVSKINNCSSYFVTNILLLKGIKTYLYIFLIKYVSLIIDINCNKVNLHQMNQKLLNYEYHFALPNFCKNLGNVKE